MMLDPWWSGLASTTCHGSVLGFARGGVVGVERWVRLVGGWLAHCWVLKHQGQFRVRRLSGGCWVCVSGCPSFALLSRWGGGGLVGLLFEICIVDASIN